MKTFNLVIFLLILTTSIFAQQTNALRGLEKPVYKNVTETLSCYVYKKYVVKTLDEGKGGEVTIVHQQNEAVPSKKSCLVNTEPIITVKNSSGLKDGYDGEDVTHSFYGIYGKYLFIDKAVEPFQGAFEIFDLTTAKSLFKAMTYGDDVKLLQNRLVIFENWAEKDGLEKNCKEARKLKKEGLAVGWVEKKQLDLQTFKVKKIGLRCEGVQ